MNISKIMILTKNDIIFATSFNSARGFPVVRDRGTQLLEIIYLPLIVTQGMQLDYAWHVRCFSCYRGSCCIVYLRGPASVQLLTVSMRNENSFVCRCEKLG